MNKKQTIRLNESQLKRIVSESVKRIFNEVAIKGKSGKTYSLHGTDPEAWGIMQRLRYLNGNNIPNGIRDEDNFIELDDKAHPNPRSRNNAKRIGAMFNRMWDAGDDIQAARQIDESKIKKAIKESVKRVLKESLFDEAEETFEKIREYYGENKDALIDSLWFFIDNKPGFINYMKKSLQYPEDEEDY